MLQSKALPRETNSGAKRRRQTWFLDALQSWRVSCTGVMRALVLKHAGIEGLRRLVQWRSIQPRTSTTVLHINKSLGRCCTTSICRGCSQICSVTVCLRYRARVGPSMKSWKPNRVLCRMHDPGECHWRPFAKTGLLTGEWCGRRCPNSSLILMWRYCSHSLVSQDCWSIEAICGLIGCPARAPHVAWHSHVFSPSHR